MMANQGKSQKEYQNQKNHNKILSWALYDWGNSAYSTTVMAGFFPLFFKLYWSDGQDAVVTTAQLGSVLSLSGLFVAIASPTLGALADRRDSRKSFCLLFTLIACACCVWMAFIPKGAAHQAMWAYGISMAAFAAAMVFYDSLLPLIAKGWAMDRASTWGYALGYLGGGILFALNVAMYLKPNFFGLQDGVQAVQASFFSVAIWWLLFSLPLFLFVPSSSGKEKEAGNILKMTWDSLLGLKKTAKDIFRDSSMFYFLLAYWLYIDGVYTVMSMAVDFGLSLHLESKHLIAALLLTQFIGFPATWLFGRLTHRSGSKIPILICLAAYSCTVIAAVFMSHVSHFYILAAVIGMVQGGVQALSRSLFARMVPKARSSEYFGAFNLIGKFASVFGPLLVAVTVTLTGESRWGMLGLLVLFILGAAFLWAVKEPTEEGDHHSLVDVP